MLRVCWNGTDYLYFIQKMIFNNVICYWLKLKVFNNLKLQSFKQTIPKINPPKFLSAKNYRPRNSELKGTLKIICQWVLTRGTWVVKWQWLMGTSGFSALESYAKHSACLHAIWFEVVPHNREFPSSNWQEWPCLEDWVQLIIWVMKILRADIPQANKRAMNEADFYVCL